MKKGLLITGLLAFIAAGAQAQPWLEDFNNGIPGTWTLVNVDNLTPDPSVNFINNAWVARIKTNANGAPLPGDSVAMSNSYYTPAGTANDWLISPAFTVSNNMILQWDVKALDASFPDGYEVRVSTTGTAVGDFSTVLYSEAAADASQYNTRGASLAAYNGQTIHIAFRNNSTDQFLLAIDNIEAKVLANADDITLTAVTPVVGSPLGYSTVNTNIALGGTMKNLGATNVTSFKVNYQQGSGPVTTSTISSVNVPPLGTYTFAATPYTLPGTLGDYPIKFWVELAGDAVPANDSNTTTVTAVGFKPAKRLFVEEGTGTWCGWCPRGAVYMDSLAHTYGNNVSLVAVHNNDPMVLSAYDAFVGGSIGGYPSVLVDRRREADPSELLDIYDSEKNYFGFADITLTNVAVGGFGYSVKATVRPALNLNGDYRLVMVLTENDVTGTGAGWGQTNYYSFQSNNIPLVGAGHVWNTENATVPADKMVYEFVARHVVPSPTGAPGSLPASMIAGTDYDYTFNTTIRADYKRDKMHAVVALIRNSDGQVLNSNSITIPVGISDVTAGVQGLRMFPNPATNNTTIRFTLDANTNVTVQVVDAMGRLVNTLPAQSMNKGTQTINLSTADLATGLYHVKIQTDKGVVTQNLSVIK